MIFFSIVHCFFIIAILFLIFLSVYLLFLPLIHKRKAQKELENFFMNSKILYHKVHGENFDYNFSLQDTQAYIKIVEIPSNCDLQINNKTTWQIFENVSLHKGTYKCHFVKEIEDFICSPLSNKFILLTQKPVHRKVVLNECEMKLFDGHTVVYDYHVITKDEFNVLKEIQDLKNVC